jgi:hypothetical protein
VFFGAVAGSLFSSFAGAYGAQRIAERGKAREELLKEIRATNTALIVAFGICNSLLAMKKQLAKPMKERFDSGKANCLGLMEERKAGLIPPNTIFRFNADLQSLPKVLLPVDILQRQAFESLSLVGRPVALVTTLRQTVEALNESIEMRNRWIDAVKETGKEVPVEIYFGLPYGGGHINLELANYIEAIHAHTEGGIHFGYLLCRDLREHGLEARKQFQKSFRGEGPRINEPLFKRAEEEGLMPDPAQFADWETMFQRRDI